MISRVKVKNYRSLRDVDVTLGQLNVLVGKNGAGKSNFIDAISFVRDALNTNIRNAVFERLPMQNNWSEEAAEFRIDVSSPPYSSSYSFRLVLEGFSEMAVVEESAFAQFNGKPEQRMVAVSGKLDSNRSTVRMPEASEVEPVKGLLLPTLLPFLRDCKPLMDRLRNVDVYQLPADVMKGLQKEAPPFPLSGRGENLASFLFEVCKNNRWKADIVAPLQRIVEGVTDIRVDQSASYLLTELEYASAFDAAWRVISQESEGTIRALAILAALNQMTSGFLLAIEEPELHLHPGALSILADVIRETSLRRQVLITTQSPDLISHFNAVELLIVENVGGETHIGPIDPVQRDVINSQLFSGGDLLRIEGLHLEASEAVNA